MGKRRNNDTKTEANLRGGVVKFRNLKAAALVLVAFSIVGSYHELSQNSPEGQAKLSSSEANPLNEMSGLKGDLVEEHYDDLDPFKYSDPFQSSTHQAVGFYSERGKLINPTSLPLEGYGFVKIFQERNSHYGTFDMVEIVRWSAEALRRLYPYGERLQVADIAHHDGGQLFRHASHQTGLDVDLIYLRRNHMEQPVRGYRSFKESFVRRGKVTENFDSERNWTLMKVLVGTGRISRIFVDKAIKKSFCDLAYERREHIIYREVLRKIRPWRHHDDHMHVRITCPVNSPTCRDQIVVQKAATGCDFDQILMAQGVSWEKNYTAL